MIQHLFVLWHRLTALVRRGRLERDLDDEVAFHLAMREAAYRDEGLSPDEARVRARRRFGNATSLKEQTRDMWIFPSFESLGQDVRYALRTLRKAPAFTFVAVFVLAVGIGSTTAIFSVINAVRMGALPYPDPARLVELWGNVQRTTVERRGASYPDFADWRARSQSFADLAAVDLRTVTLTTGPESERIPAEFVSAPYFSLLGVQPAQGRTFSNDEDIVGKAPNVLVLSDGLWRRRFGGDPRAIGQTVTLNATAYTVIGLMPTGFKGINDQAELWIPFALYAPPQAMAQRGSRGFFALARLKPDVTMGTAQAEMDRISRQLEQAYPDTNEKRAVEISPLDVELFGQLRPALFTLMGAVVFVLLIACANVSNLLLARSEARQREIAVRTALGAGWARLLRQLVTEGCVLAALGAAAGLLLASGAVRLLLATSPITLPSFIDPRIDPRVALFTVLVSIACGMILGLAPALHARVSRIGEALKDSTRGSDGRRSQRVRGGLIVAEVSLAVVLLIGAGLMIRSVRNLATIDPGFDPASVLTLRVSIPRAAVRTPPDGAPAGPPPPLVVESRALVEKVGSVPGVVAASLGTDMPLDGNASAVFYTADGQAPVTAQNIPRAYVHRVTPDFFSTLRIPIVSGRTFTDAESAASSTAVVVSERVVKRFWPGQDPIGRRVKFGGPGSTNPWMSIVGVVGEVKYRGLPDNPTADPDIYLPYPDRNQQISMAIRTSVAPASIVAAVRAAIRSADASIPIYQVAPMEDLVDAQTSQARFTMWLMGVFAACALMLAVVGIYGVMSYLVTQRTREIGIRLALGARRGDILRLVVGNGFRMVGAGIAIGVAAAFALQRLVSTLLFGVTATDAASFVAVVLLAAVALGACYLPALRATRVNPLAALRY